MGSDFDASQLLKGSLDLAVLAVLAREDDYGYGIARRIWEAGLTDVREASIYGTLIRLFRGGLLSTRVEASASGPHRKYYALSATGRAYLRDGTQAWQTTSTAINHLLASATTERHEQLAGNTQPGKPGFPGGRPPQAQ